MEAVKMVTWKVIGFFENVWSPYPGGPTKGGGTCENCGQGIRYCVKVLSSEGVGMVVGQDCAVTMEGGVELAEIRRAEREYQLEEYMKSPEYAAKKARLKAVREEEEESARLAKFLHAMELQGLDMILSSPHPSRYAQEQAQHRKGQILKGKWMELTDRDCQTLGVAIKAAMSPPSKHAGAVGTKVEFVATLEAMIPIPDGGWKGQGSFVQKFRAKSGEVLVWFSNGGNYGRRHVGSTVKIKGTVKSHGEYEGVAQTTLTRCKVEILEKVEIES